jgi:hypothetical protein
MNTELKTLLEAYETAAAPVVRRNKEIAAKNFGIETFLARCSGVRFEHGRTPFDSLCAAIASKDCSADLRGQLEELRLDMLPLREQLQMALPAFNAAAVALEQAVEPLVADRTIKLHNDVGTVRRNIIEALKPFTEDERQADNLAGQCQAVVVAESKLSRWRMAVGFVSQARLLIAG